MSTVVTSCDHPSPTQSPPAAIDLDAIEARISETMGGILPSDVRRLVAEVRRLQRLLAPVQDTAREMKSTRMSHLGTLERVVLGTI